MNKQVNKKLIIEKVTYFILEDWNNIIIYSFIRVVVIINRLLITPKPVLTECLTGYISRVARANFVSSHDLWRLFLVPSSHYPQSSMSIILDTYPASTFNYIQFGEMLNVEHIEHLTLIPVFKKIGITDTEILKSRALGGMIEKHRKYCPKCLKENDFYKLMWQVAEVKWCDIHCVTLLEECWNCHKRIPLLPSAGQVGKCPYCECNLAEATTKHVNIGEKKERILRDWQYLLNPEMPGLTPADNLSNQQQLAILIILALQNNSEKIKIPTSIMQSARKSRVYESYTHLALLLSILRDVQISLDDFFKLQISEEFVYRILTRPAKIIHRTACLTPWCKGYLKTGTLQRTATSTKMDKNGEKLNYYMVCTECGIEYCLSGPDKGIRERGYFLSFAYNKILPLLRNTNCIKQLAKAINEPEDKIRRSIIYLAANGLIRESKLPLSIPPEHDEEIIKVILNKIRIGTQAKQIRRDLNMKYNDFLFYWFEPRIRIANVLNKPINRPQRMQTTSSKDLLRLRDALAYCKDNNIRISIKLISKILEVCPETIRLWGMLPEIKQAKEVQRLALKENRKKELLKKAEEIIKFNKSIGKLISIELVYKELGYHRTSMWRDHPEVAKHISQLVNRINDDSVIGWSVP
ncbi:TniQ family protein [Desulfosporosinus meridiei]|uniref:TniQ domain-containing protein n=1 Tax=Desulfosporosinus meridiei (strain ATCC BAA-275 / DSM 13257 / KCTC 12902 / NCIMB 13706 / S10) TaxID=768704 RepID=J7IKY1_DESMD|nr:TniQ family protein [Desulfosporosinus meridiei]AFQ42442.1 hypothetical protein Desmer_0387 [Desulfosporosinus meridiei DSM 13257]